MMENPYIPKDAPFSGDQRAWLGGFFAGLHSKLAVTNQQAAVSHTVQAPPINILFGTQTGNSEELANEAAGIAKLKGYRPKVSDLDSVTMDQLGSMEQVLIVISTYGEGEMPDNAQLFWDSLSSSTAPRLESMSFGVIALGDTGYEHFCRAGKLVDTRLEQLGATRFAPRLDCDVDFEEPSMNWLDEHLPQAGDGVIEDDDGEPTKPKWSRKNPFQAEVIDNRKLSGPKSAKEIRHIAFDLGDSGLTYDAGDALGVIPVNAPDLVQAWLDRLGAEFDTQVDGYQVPLGELLTSRLEIRTPSQELLDSLPPIVQDEEFTHVMQSGDRKQIDDFLWSKDTLDLLCLNSEAQYDLPKLLGWLKPLQYRAYSISSSPDAHLGEVHLTVAAVRWNYSDREHRGVCSTYLADMVPVGQQAGIFIMPNKGFRIPTNDDAAMIMVGPGTGIAPFRAFLEARRERNAKGINWLFFGDQHRESDFIYEQELQQLSEAGVLSRLDLAFSRDQEEKVYVQHRMLHQGKELFGFLQEGAHFYVCGDASRMAKDVDDALHSIVETHGNMNKEAAAKYVNELKREKRYVRDVY